MLSGARTKDEVCTVLRSVPTTHDSTGHYLIVKIAEALKNEHNSLPIHLCLFPSNHGIKYQSCIIVNGREQHNDCFVVALLAKINTSLTEPLVFNQLFLQFFRYSRNPNRTFSP